MNYDFRAGGQHLSPAYGHSMYPRVAGEHGHQTPVGRPSPSHRTAPPPPSSAAGLGIRVVIKPDYRITPPLQLSSQVGDIPRSDFEFDFDFERKVLAEAEKERQNWSGIGMANLPSRTSEINHSPSPGPTGDPIVSKYIASGLSREALPFVDPQIVEVREFVNGYTLLGDMGFSSNKIAKTLIMYENDADRALAHFLNSSC